MVKSYALIPAVAVLGLASYCGVSVIKGHGRLHELARKVYHHYQDIQMQKVYAAEVKPERADAPMVVYQDHLAAGWQDWSWISHSLKSTAVLDGGTASIEIKPDNWKGLFFHHDTFSTVGYGALQVNVYGRSLVDVCVADGSGKFKKKVHLQSYLKPSPHLPSGWRVAKIPLADLDVTLTDGGISGIVFQAASGSAQPSLWLDELELLPDMSLPPTPTEATVPVTINLAAARHPISPLIYGMAFAPTDYLTDLRIPVNRWGGNDKSRYNWVLGNADNAAHDWQWRNRYASDKSIPMAPSSAADKFVHDNEAGGAASLLTVPTIGWVAKDADNNHASQNVPGQGGDPLTNAAGAIAGYDPTENREITSVRSVARKNGPFSDSPPPSGVVYQDEWIAHLKSRFGDAAHGGVRFYAMDNEPDLWDQTHTDVHPARMGYDDVLSTFLSYATAVKAVDPTAQITGPVSWGWTGYEYSALDRGSDNFHTHADFTRHGDEWFLPWFLKQVHAHDAKSGRRSLDVLDVHYYPQSGVYGNQLDKDSQAKRLRAPQSLWDPSYVDESWIHLPIQLIPRLQAWVNQCYPGTKIGITEWNFGGDQDINGALAIADVLGIYGRENLYLANYWAYPKKDSPGYLAFKLYRNADGRGHGFGDTALGAVSAEPGRLSSYAALDSQTGDLTIMLVNKMPKATVTAPITLQGAFGAKSVKRWQLAADRPDQIVAFPAVSLRGRALTLTLPKYSATLLRLSKQDTATP